MTVVSKHLLLVAQDLETMSINKSRFLQEEHGQMERYVAALRQVDELRHELKVAHRESQDRVVEATGAREAEQRAVKRVTTAVQKLHVA